ERQLKVESCGDERRGLAREIDDPVALDETAGCPSARDRADIRQQIHAEQCRADRCEDPAIARGKQVHPLRLDQEIREPEQEQVPYGVGEELAADEVPRLPLADCLAPGQRLAGRILAILFDIGELFRTEPWVL